MKKQKKKYLSFLTDFQELEEGFHKLNDFIQFNGNGSNPILE